MKVCSPLLPFVLLCFVSCIHCEASYAERTQLPWWPFRCTYFRQESSSIECCKMCDGICLLFLNIQHNILSCFYIYLQLKKIRFWPLPLKLEMFSRVLGLCICVSTWAAVWCHGSVWILCWNIVGKWSNIQELRWYRVHRGRFNASLVIFGNSLLHKSNGRNKLL